MGKLRREAAACEEENGRNPPWCVEPQEVMVRIEGTRNQVYLSDPTLLEVRVDAVMAPLGRKTFAVTPAEVEHPETLRILAVDPTRVRVEVRRAAPG